MRRQTTPSARIIHIFLSLMERGQATTRELARAVGATPRTTRADLKLLSELAPVCAVGERESRRWRIDPRLSQQGLGVIDRIALELGRGLTSFVRAALFESDDFAPLDGIPQRYARHLDRKLRLHREPERDYTAHRDTVDTVLDALLRERRIDFHYRGRDGDRSVRDFQPLTLVVYRRALYLLGRTGDDAAPRLHAVDRMFHMEQGEPFSYPSSWCPDEHLGDRFGIVPGGPPADVILRFTPQVTRYVQSRRWHPTQRLVERPDGGLDLHMHTSGGELERFALEWGQQCEVLAPAELRLRVRRALTEALAAYSDDFSLHAVRSDDRGASRGHEDDPEPPDTSDGTDAPFTAFQESGERS